MSKYFEIVLAFFKPGVFGFGGGQAVIPLIREEVVEVYGWFSIEEFSDAYALGNTLPGPIAPKMAAFVGYKVGGIWGAFLAVIAHILPSILAIIALGTIYYKFKNAAWLKGMMTAVRPVVIVLIAQVVFMMAGKSFGTPSTYVIAVLAITALFLNVHPIILISGAIAYGGLFIR